VIIDSSMTYSIFDVLLVGRRGTAAMRIEVRPTRRSSTTSSSA
jgi:hypothetical protein